MALALRSGGFGLGVPVKEFMGSGLLGLLAGVVRQRQSQLGGAARTKTPARTASERAHQPTAAGSPSAPAPFNGRSGPASAAH